MQVQLRVLLTIERGRQIQKRKAKTWSKTSEESGDMQTVYQAKQESETHGQEQNQNHGLRNEDDWLSTGLAENTETLTIRGV